MYGILTEQLNSFSKSNAGVAMIPYRAFSRL